MLELIVDFGRGRLPWKRLSFFLPMILAAFVLTSCGKGSSASTTSPPSVTVTCNAVGGMVTLNGTTTCMASVLNETSTLANWSISPSGTGSITSGATNSSTATYKAPSTFPGNNMNVVTITAASVVASSVTGTAIITIEQPTVINAVSCLDPNNNNQSSSTVSSGNPLVCSAVDSTGAAVPGVNWTVTNATNPMGNNGTISLQGTYTAPLVPPAGQAITITATSQTDATNSKSLMVTVVFGNKVLSGPYAFSTKGRVTNATNAFLARVGILTASPASTFGTLTGIEDTNQSGASGTVQTQVTFSGSFSIGSDGRGTMQFCENVNVDCPPGSPAATSFFRFVVVSPLQVRLIDFSDTTTSATATSEGEMDFIPDTGIFNRNGLSGTYSFGFSGISLASTEESAVGEFKSDGFGNISTGNSTTPGAIDIDAMGSQFLTGTTYSIFSNGRGIVTLNGLRFSFYMVSAGRAKFMEIDPSPASILVGDAYKQQLPANCPWGLNSLTGSSVFATGGELTPSGVAVADLGSFTASNDGTTGTVSTGSIDENNGGSPSSQLGTLSGNYTVDACGRGTLSIGTHTYVFYPISTGSAVLQETTSGIIAHGFLVQPIPPQGGSFVNGSLKGSYALNLNGTNAPGVAGKQEDILGQLTADGAGSVKNGSLDINSFGTTTGNTGAAITSGTYVPAPAGASAAGALRATMSLTPTRSLVLYLVSPTLFYALDTDTTGTAIGAIYNQF